MQQDELSTTTEALGRESRQSLIRAHDAWFASRRLTGRLWFELISGAVAALWIGSFLADNIRDVRFALPASVLLIAAVLMIAASAGQLAVLSKLGCRGPLGETRRAQGQLRALRGTVLQWVLRLCPLMWLPIAIVMAQAWIGFDVYAAFGPLWAAACLIAGLILMDLVTLLIAKVAVPSRADAAKMRRPRRVNG